MPQHSLSQGLGQDLLLGEVGEQLPTSSAWLCRVSAVNKAAIMPGIALEMWKIKHWAPEGCFPWNGIEFECLCSGLTDLNPYFFNYLQENLHIQIYS